MRVLLAGRRSFGIAVLGQLLDRGHEVLVVSRCERLQQAARRRRLDAWDAVAAAPTSVDLIVAAHSHDFISRRRRHLARLGAIGYHPSLLPRHRGRSAVEWTIRFGDAIAGGTVYHLDDRVDAGPIAAQALCHVRPGDTASSLWRRELFPVGVELIGRVVDELALGIVCSRPQDERVATFEPDARPPRLARPDLPELPAGRP